MRDGARLPSRLWLTDDAPRAVVLALHGFNDSRDGWEMPAPEFAAVGIAVYAQDQRGFGRAPGRGAWPGSDGLVNDAADTTQALRARHPGTKLILMGESMGGAVPMLLATGPQRPDVDGYVLLAPAVWDRGRMNPFMRSLLWLAGTVTPGLHLTGPPPAVHITASDNDEAPRRSATPSPGSTTARRRYRRAPRRMPGTGWRPRAGRQRGVGTETMLPSGFVTVLVPLPLARTLPMPVDEMVDC